MDMVGLKAMANQDRIYRLIDQSINQSANQTSIAPISPVKPGSMARQQNQRSTVKLRKQFHDINRPSGMPVSMGERSNQKCVLRCFMKVATEMAERTDSSSLFQRDGSQEWQALGPVLVCTLGTDRLLVNVQSEWVGWKWYGKLGVKGKRLYFMKHLLGQQINLEQYSKPYCQPMKGMKRRKTAGKWRRFCHQAGQLILNTLQPCEVNVRDTMQKWIAIIKANGHESSCE